MVSDKIQIESLKYCRNREIVEPINVVLNINDSYIEKYPSNINDFGTRVSLEIKSDYAKKLNYERLVKIIEDNMAYQSIPVQIECDGNSKILKNQKIILQEGINDISGIQVIEIDTDLLEGYLVLHGYQHQSMFDHVKLCQQGFKISLKDGVPNLMPEWLNFLKYNLNIKKKYLTLKASREGVVENDNFHSIRKEIGKAIIEYYKDKPLALSPFLNDGRGNTLSAIKEENNFLTDAIVICVVRDEKLYNCTLKQLLEILNGRRKKIAIIDPKVHDYLRENKEEYLIFSSDHFIILSQYHSNWFIQYIDLYLESAEEVISHCPGVIYLEGIINMEKGYQIPAKNSGKLWKTIKCSNDELFCYVSNNQVHILDITLNENNSNVRILNKNLGDLRVKGLKDIIVENIRQRVLHHEEKWGNIIDYGGAYMNLRDREQAPSIQTVGCLELEFAELLNKFIHDKYTNDELKDMKINGIYFKKENFVAWWYKN